MAVEVANSVWTIKPALGHDVKELFHDLGQVLGIVEGGLENVGQEVLWQQARVLGKEAKDEAIEKPGDAEILLLGNGDLGTGPGIGQLDALSALKQTGDFGNLLGELFGDLSRRPLRLQELGFSKRERRIRRFSGRSIWSLVNS